MLAVPMSIEESRSLDEADARRIREARKGGISRWSKTHPTCRLEGPLRAQSAQLGIRQHWQPLRTGVAFDPSNLPEISI